MSRQSLGSPSAEGETPQTAFLFVSLKLMVAKQFAVFNRKNQFQKNRLRFHFSFLCLFSQRKSGVSVWVFIFLYVYSGSDTLSVNPLSFDTNGAKESSQRKRRKIYFARCDERQGLLSLEPSHLAGGAYMGAVRHLPLRAFIGSRARLKIFVEECANFISLSNR